MKKRLETEQNVPLYTDNHEIMAGRLGFLCQGINFRTVLPLQQTRRYKDSNKKNSQGSSDPIT